MTSRRRLIKSVVLASLFPLCFGRAKAADFLESLEFETPVSVILPNKSSLPPPGQQRQQYQKRLCLAVQDFISEHYSGSILPVWGQPYDQVAMDKRLVNILHWIVLAVERQAETYSVDPSWIIAQIMAESFFYEFAVSEQFAVGICQFIRPTARKYGMTCPESTSLEPAEIRAYDKAGELERLKSLQRRKRQLGRENRDLFRNREALLKSCLAALAKGESMPNAGRWLQALKEMEALERSIGQARTNYMDFLKANYAGRSIFNRSDLAFLVRFDERVTYKKPILAMVTMMAEHLRVRNGNLLAATAGYNAGLPTTSSTFRIYKDYGGIPAIEETVKYLNLIVVNHHEIIKRL
jgi:hypothetical protein